MSRIDEMLTDTQKRIYRAEQKVQDVLRPLSSDEMNQLDAARARADSVAAHYGARASDPLPGERPADYRRRLLAPYLKHSPQLKGAKADSIPSELLDAVETRVYADAIREARNPNNYAPGELREVKERDASGRLISRFYGDNLGWMHHWMTGAQICNIRDPRNR